MAAVSIAVLVLALGACESKKSGDAATAGPDDSKVAGKIAGKNVTVGEIDAWIKDQLFKQTTRGGNPLKTYEVRNRALEQMASEQALDAEAAKSGKDRDTLLKEEVEKRAAVSDEDVQKYYDDNKERFRSMPFEKVAPAVKRQLLAQKQVAAMQEYVGALRQSLGYQNDLAPPRFEIAIGTSPSQGPGDAPITLVEFSDYECPFCKSAEPIVKQVKERYPTQLRFVTKNFPLDAHPKAKPAAEAAVCAAEQGKFWEYHDLLFDKAPQIDAPQLGTYAEQAGLDKAKFDECLAAHRGEPVVKADLEEGQKAGVSGTPAFFVNGVPLAGGRSLNDFAKAIDTELARLNLPVPPPPPPPAPAARMQMPPGHPGSPQMMMPGGTPPAAQPGQPAPNAAAPTPPPVPNAAAPAPPPNAAAPAAPPKPAAAQAPTPAPAAQTPKPAAKP
jgi:protein-disulfide isomerase